MRCKKPTRRVFGHPAFKGRRSLDATIGGIPHPNQRELRGLQVRLGVDDPTLYRQACNVPSSLRT